MGVTLKRILTLAITLLLATPALAQTAPELFTFQPGTPIRADEMNANFQLLRDHVTNALGIADLTSDDLEELANLVQQLQTLAASGELHGSSLEYEWDGTTLGIKRDNEESFTYVNLLGATGPQGEAGPGLEYEWDGARLGVRAAGQTEFDYVNLAGAQGPIGETGERGERGDQGEPGRDGSDGQDGADGRNIVFGWNGTQLGVGYEGEALTYVDIQGPEGAQGIQGIQGEQGPRGEQGEQGPRGERGEPGPQGAQGDPGVPGPTGPQGDQGAQGETGQRGPQGLPGESGADGAPGLPGVNGRNLEFDWDETRLGVRYEGDTEYQWVELRGLRGPGLNFQWDGSDLLLKGAEETEWSRADLKGDPGPQGPAGANGADGANGRTLLNGSFSPPDAIGRDGDFYLDTSTWQIYGPKTDTWGTGTSLVGPAGQDGENYTAGNGISIVNSVIGLTHFQTLPNCWGGEVPQSSGSGWVCAPSVDTYFGPSDITGNMGDGKYHECVLGDVWLTANTFGSATIADGRILSIAQNTALYSLLGSRYGGNGSTTFALPDLTHVSPRSANGESLHYVICTVGIFPYRD